MNREKIGFWGGCFNPPSLVHIDLASRLLKDLNLSKIVFVPVGDYYEKPELAKAVDRYNMIKIATDNIKNLEVEDIEITSSKKLYAKDAFKMIQGKYFDKDIYFIMGSDNFLKMPSWKDYDNIIETYNYIIVRRPNFNVNINIKNVMFYDLPQTKDISSTIIRNYLKNNINLEKYIDRNVYKYIKDNNLYNT